MGVGGSDGHKRRDPRLGQSTDGATRYVRFRGIIQPGKLHQIPAFQLRVLNGEECKVRPFLRNKLRPSPALLIAITALVVALGGVAYATIPDSGGVIHGCYLKAVGSLRVIDPSTGQHCTVVETPIQWNQTGPQGPSGATGPAGPVGPAGPASFAYVDVNGESGRIPLDDTYQTVQTLGSLPAGSYAVTATATVGGSPAGDHADCYLSMQGIGGAYVFGTALGTAPQAMSLQGAAVSDGPSGRDTVYLHCATEAGSAVYVDKAQIMAISVAAIGRPLGGH